MVMLALATFVLSVLGLWLCLPATGGEKRGFLRGGLDTVAALAITSGVGLSIVFLANSIIR
jgi:hypothetical protein